jgi:hypothetical protein
VFVGDHHPRLVPTPVDDTTEEGFGRLLVAPRLHQDVEHDPVLVDRPPEPVLAPVDLQLHLITVPFVARSGTAPAQPIGEDLPELRHQRRMVS